MLPIALIASLAVSDYDPKPFDKYDYAMLGTLALVSTYDVMNTRAVVGRRACHQATYNSTPYENHPSHPYQTMFCATFQEGDPILSKNPDAFRLWATFVLAQSLTVVTARFLPDPWRKLFESTVLTVESTNVAFNINRARVNGLTWGASTAIKF